MTISKSLQKKKYDFVIFYPSFFETNFGKGWKRSTAEIPPIGPLYVAAPLIRAGYEVRFCDLNVEYFTDEEFSRLVLNTRIFGISFLTFQHDSAIRLINSIRKVRQDACVIAGGHHCRLTDKPFPGATVTVTTEAEEQIVELIQAIENNRPLEHIPGLLYHSNSTLIRTPALKNRKQLDELLWPARELLDSGNYGFLFNARISKKVAGVLSSRGCVYKCSYCIRSPYPPYRERSVESVVEEMNALYREGYDTVFMADEYFLANQKRVARIMDELILKKIKLNIIFQTRVNTIDEDFCRKLKKGGTLAILFGIESACDDVLKFYNKKATPEQAHKAIRAAHRAGIFTYGGFIFGAPMETRAHLQKNIAFVTRAPLDFASFHHLAYMYSTPIWQEANKRGLVSDGEYCVPADERFGGPSAKEINRWRYRAFKKFYCRPMHILQVIRKCVMIGNFIPCKVAFRFIIQTIRDVSKFNLIHRNLYK